MRRAIKGERLKPGVTEVYLGDLHIADFFYNPSTLISEVRVTLESVSATDNGKRQILSGGGTHGLGIQKPGTVQGIGIPGKPNRNGSMDDCISYLRKLVPHNTPAFQIKLPIGGVQ